MRNPPRKISKSRRKPTTSIGHLPEEVLLLILHKLPITSLLRCTSICKYWYTLIKNPNFISTHLGLTLSASKNNTTTDPLLLIRQFQDGLVRYALHFGSREEEEKGQMFIASPSRKLKVPIFEVIGLCNGLVCLGDATLEHIVLWNPWIRKYYALPKTEMLPRMDVFCRHGGLGFDSNSNDYKFLKITQFNPNFEVKICVELYSLNWNSWKTIDTTFLSDIVIDDEILGCLCFASGSLHYTAVTLTNVHVTVILAFNVDDEAFHVIMLPESLRLLDSLTLQVVGYDNGSSIAVQKFDFDFGQCEVWVMRTYAAVESWTKLLIITNHFCQPKVLGFRKDGKVLIQMKESEWFGLPAPEDVDGIEVVMKYGEGSLVLCDPQSKKSERLRTWRKHGHSYISSMESLVLLDKENDNSMQQCGVMVQRKEKRRKKRCLFWPPKPILTCCLCCRLK